MGDEGDFLWTFTVFFLSTFMWTFTCSPIWLRYRFQCNALANQRLTNTVAAIRDLVFNTSLLMLKLSIDLKYLTTCLFTYFSFPRMLVTCNRRNKQLSVDINYNVIILWNHGYDRKKKKNELCLKRVARGNFRCTLTLFLKVPNVEV